MDDPSSLGSRRVGKISWMLLSCFTTDCPLLPVIMEESFAHQGSESVTWLENMHKIWHLSMCFVCMFVVTQVKVTLGIWSKDNWTTFCLSKFWGIKTANNLHYYSWLWSRGRVWLLATFSFFSQRMIYTNHSLIQQTPSNDVTCSNFCNVCSTKEASLPRVLSVLSIKCRLC